MCKTGGLLREAIQLVKDFTMEHAQGEVEFYMGMVAEKDQSFKGLAKHLLDTFQSGEMLSEQFLWLVSKSSGDWGHFHWWYAGVGQKNNTA